MINSSTFIPIVVPQSHLCINDPITEIMDVFVSLGCIWWVFWQLKSKGKLKAEQLWRTIGEGITGVLATGSVTDFGAEVIAMDVLHAGPASQDVWLLRH